MAPSSQTHNHPVDWRWQQAAQLSTEESVRWQSVEDPFVRAAARLLRGAPVPCAEKQLVDTVGSAITHKRSWSLLPHHTEMLVLAGYKQAAIADMLRVELRIVAAYEALYFDVRPHLKNVSYVQRAAIWRSGSAEGSADPYTAFLHFMAMEGSPEILDAYIGKVPAGSNPSTPVVSQQFPPDELAPELKRLEKRWGVLMMRLAPNGDDNSTPTMFASPKLSTSTDVIPLLRASRSNRRATSKRARVPKVTRAQLRRLVATFPDNFSFT